MSNANKIKGDKAERAVREFLREHGFPHAERTKAGYERDGGDVHLDPTVGLGPGVIAQVKDVARYAWVDWLAGLRDQIIESHAKHGFMVVKRRGFGDAGTWLAVMPLADLTRLLREAGYGEES